MIPYFRLRSNEDELGELMNVHKNASWAVGEQIKEVETQLVKLFNKKHVVLTSNGNSALFVAIKALGISKKEIIVPCISTCFAITNAVVTSGNSPVFCDVNESDGNCSLEHVTQLAKEKNIKYIISPNFAGSLSAISEFKKLGLIVIEDSCQSFHSSIDHVSEADMQIFSFYPTKGINGIDGGAILLDDIGLAQKATKLAHYDNQTNFEITERYNFRFLNAHAAVLLANLNRLVETQERLRYLQNSYLNVLNNRDDLKVLGNQKSKIRQRFVINVNDLLKQRIKETFQKEEIALSPFFAWNCIKEQQSEFSNASKMVNNTFCLPYFEDLSDKELEIVKKALDYVFTQSKN
jgi:dTDP-4-amino-4,6-dideoxygalactose transaminase